MSGSTLILPTFAKVNWNLRVLGKRPDGYHELDTILQTISLHDTIALTATESPEIVLSCDDRTLPTGADNLIYRAAEALQVRFAPGKGAHIRLEKRIPAQAGLGGGSADAAVTLLGLTFLWGTSAKVRELLEIANSLGADVPFFFFGGTARGVGIGKDLAPLRDTPDQFLLVLKPNASMSTGVAYESLKARSLTSAEAKTILSSSAHGEISDCFDSKVLQNDFEQVVFELEPEIKRAKIALMKAGAEVALLAGSGSAVFGIFDSGDAQERAIQAIELEAGWRVFPCRTVGRNAYRSALGAAGEILGR
ncbi:MAG TPA: 4-(cytidine 5'-diphospho)-2-C-methyl-D-erythritol kinase [Pyrinomonadaceae bacterium]|nr:4-(cytidine 5'-diphospho)-2-C-methyl-D-erythritol kinase [Pyrinomonadaceae bacterium]